MEKIHRELYGDDLNGKNWIDKHCEMIVEQNAVNEIPIGACLSLNGELLIILTHEGKMFAPKKRVDAQIVEWEDMFAQPPQYVKTNWYGILKP